MNNADEEHDAHARATGIDRAIRTALHRYCRGIDRLDRDLVLATWWPEGTAKYEGIFEGTGQDFVDWFFSRNSHGNNMTSHQITSVLIEHRGHRSVSEAYALITQRTSGDPDAMVIAGRYLDVWSERDATWAVDRRHFRVDITYRIPCDAGPAKAASGRADPSYALFDYLRDVPPSDS